MSLLTYKASGVNVALGEEAIRKIMPHLRSTFSPEVSSSLGGYAGLYALSLKKFKEPVLVASADGVGTKLAIAALMNRHDTVGRDLVAMSVNDVIVSGATPLFFMDYFATGVLSPPQLVDVVKGIVKGCRKAGCALIGGETAEMPGFYKNGDYDLAGFAVGIVEKKEQWDGRKIRPGDIIIGLASSGLHSNGYSLARKIVFEKMGLTVNDRFKGFKKTVGEILLTPTTIYATVLSKVMKRVEIKGAAHITGGGMTRNIPRILPQHCAAKLRRDYPVPRIFKILQRAGNVDPAEMYNTFNMGVGMALVVAPRKAELIVALLKGFRQRAFILGRVVEQPRGEQKVIYG